MAFTTSNTVSKDSCHDWPLDECKYGNRCTREHHGNLNPALVNTKAHPEYIVPNEVGEACQRCTQRMYPVRLGPTKYSAYTNCAQCDKKGRGGEDDPCSECRWFGGENCKCTLLANSSYNDQIWAVMMKRGKDHDYTLPADKNREEGSKKAKSAPQPMPAAKVKANWQGETKEALLSKADMLPPGVRDCPRAYLVPPRTSATTKKDQVWRETNLERKREYSVDSNPPSSFSTVAPQLPPIPSRLPPIPPRLQPIPPQIPPFPPQLPPFSYEFPLFPPRPPFDRPPADPVHGEVVTSSY
jgi:hypothetical protein